MPWRDRSGMLVAGPDGDVIQLLSFLGNGSFGEVYEAAGISSKRIVAVKMLPESEVGRRGQRTAALLNETNLATRKVTHPNVVDVLHVDLGSDPTVGPFLVLEFMSGGTLKELVETVEAREAQIPLERALSLMSSIAAGAEAVNSTFIHRDIKPDNILFDGPPDVSEPKISDFGISKVIGELTRSRSQTFKGMQQFMYMAPEVWRRTGPDTFKIDVYSVGIVFFEILTTRHPVGAVVKDAYHIKDWEEAHCDRPLPSVAAFRPEVSPPIVQLVRRMLDKEAQFRPTWDEVRMALALEHQRTHGHDVEMSASQVLATEIVVVPFETPTLNDVGAVVARVSDSVEGFRERVAGAPEFTMISVQGGKFEMGSPLDEPQREDQEGPQHVVSVSAFFIAQAPVTNGLWKAVASMPKVARDLDPDPSYRKADELPVVRVAWHDCVEFCARLRVTTGRAYRLPTEAEWEYACRAGTSTPFAFGPTISTEWVNYRGTDPYPNAPPTVASPGITASGSFGIANAFGIFDMHGNVQEWCADPFHPSYVGAPEDGCEWEAGDTSKAPVSRVAAPAPGKYFSSLHYVLRGGSFMNCARACRSAYRTGMPSMLLRNDKGEWIGFRLALTLTGG